MNCQRASNSAFAMSVSMLISSHSILRLGTKSSPYRSSRLRSVSSVVASPLTISKPMFATSSPTTCWNNLDSTSCAMSLPIGCSFLTCANRLAKACFCAVVSVGLFDMNSASISSGETVRSYLSIAVSIACLILRTSLLNRRSGHLEPRWSS